MTVIHVHSQQIDFEGHAMLLDMLTWRCIFRANMHTLSTSLAFCSCDHFLAHHHCITHYCYIDKSNAIWNKFDVAPKLTCVIIIGILSGAFCIVRGNHVATTQNPTDTHASNRNCSSTAGV